MLGSSQLSMNVQDHVCTGLTQKRITLLILTNLMYPAWMLLRTYSVWRCYRDLKYTQLPKKDTISNFTGICIKIL